MLVSRRPFTLTPTISSAPPPPPDGTGGPSPAAARAAVVSNPPLSAPWSGASPLPGRYSGVRVREESEEFANREAFRAKGLPVLEGVGPGIVTVTEFFQKMTAIDFLSEETGRYSLPHEVFVKGPTFSSHVELFHTLYRFLSQLENLGTLGEVRVEKFIPYAFLLDLQLMDNSEEIRFSLKPRDQNDGEATLYRSFFPKGNFLKKLEQDARTAAVASGYQGPVSVKFIVSPHDGHYYVMKVKPGLLIFENDLVPEDLLIGLMPFLQKPEGIPITRDDLMWRLGLVSPSEEDSLFQALTQLSTILLARIPRDSAGQPNGPLSIFRSDVLGLMGELAKRHAARLKEQLNAEKKK